MKEVNLFFRFYNFCRHFYNPYKNEVIQVDDKDAHESEQILVPFMLTQSGLKPLTSVEMSRRYVELFDAYKDTDAIISIGFGFNKDDSHINGLFRELVEKHNKKLFIITVDPKETAREIKKKLRLDSNMDSVKVILVDRMTRTTNESLWFDEVFKQLG